MSPRWIVSLLLAGSCSLLAGCAILGAGQERVGGHATLGDAARAANPDSTGKHRRLGVGHTVPKETETEVELPVAPPTSAPEPATSHPARREPELDEWGRLMRGHWVVGLLAGGAAIGGHRYDGFGDLGIEVGKARNRLQAAVVLSVSPTEFASQTIAGQSFENEMELNLELNGRYVLTPIHAFMGVYGIAGTRFSTLFWDYARPVPILEDGARRDVTDDHINRHPTRSRRRQPGGSAGRKGRVAAPPRLLAGGSP